MFKGKIYEVGNKSVFNETYYFLIDCLDELLEKYSSINIKESGLYAYLNYLSNSIKTENFERLINRMNKNFYFDNINFRQTQSINPLELVKELINEAKKCNLKKQFLDTLINNSLGKYLVCKKSDEDYLQEVFSDKLTSLRIISFRELHSSFNEINNSDLLIYSIFNFDEYKFLHSINSEIELCLYPWEAARINEFQEAYNIQFHNEKLHRQEILISLNLQFPELTSASQEDSLIQIKSEEHGIKKSKSLSQIFEESDRSFCINEQKEQDCEFEDESYSIQIYFVDNTSINIKSNETAFIPSGERVKVSELQAGQEIRLIKEFNVTQFFDLQNTNEFKEIYDASTIWKNALKKLWKIKCNCNTSWLYRNLKEAGLEIEENTLKGWIEDKTTIFPQKDSDLEAIAVSEMISLNTRNLHDKISFIEESKIKYANLTKKIGFKFRDELESFLILGEIGELLQSKFDDDHQKIIDWIEREFPLKLIKNIECKEIDLIINS